MSQTGNDNQQAHSPDGTSADDARRDDLPEQVNEDIGGVQGSDPDDDAQEPNPSIARGTTPDEPAPDAGEIEWAGQVVKKPPTPGN